MKLRNSVIVVAAVALAATIQTVQAAYTDSLADLVNSGGSLTIDDKIFSGFSFTENGLANLNTITPWDPSQITVTASVVAGIDILTFSGNMQLTTAGSTADLLLNYTVSTTSGNSIIMIDQRYTGGAQNGGLDIKETADSTGAPTAHSELTVNDVADPNTFLAPTGAFDTGEQDLLGVNPGQTVIYVSKDIALSTFKPGDPGWDPNSPVQVTVSSAAQSFHQVPEPTTVIAGALLLLPLGASTLRILRRNRIS